MIVTPPDIETLADIFRVEISAFAPLPCGLGYRATLKDKFNLGSCLATKKVPNSADNTSMRVKLENDDLLDFVHPCGVLILDNAFVNAAANIRISNAVSDNDGTLLQHFFHRDMNIGDSEGGATILHKPLWQGREVPTVYARMQDVVRVLMGLDPARYCAKTAAHLRGIDWERYAFDGMPDWLGNGESPTLTADIISALPSDKILTHYWRAHVSEVVVHAAGPDIETLHARPAGKESLNIVNANFIYRSI